MKALMKALLYLILIVTIVIEVSSSKCDLLSIFPVHDRGGREVLWLREYNDTISKAISDFNMQEGKSCDGQVQFQKHHVIDSSNDLGALNQLVNNSTNSNLCGIIGSFFSTEVQYSAILPMLHHYTDKILYTLPYISPTSYSNISASDYPYYFSLAPSIDQSVAAIVQYLEDIERHYVGFIYNSNEQYGHSFLRQLRMSVERRGFHIQCTDLNETNITESLRLKLSALKDTGYRTILLVMETDADISSVAKEAAALDMLDGYFWVLIYENPIFNGKPNGEEYISSEVLSFLEGSAMFTPGDAGGSDNDIFSSFGYIPVNSIYLKYVYDSVISLGVAQCNFVTSGYNVNSSIYDELLRVSFEGVSGVVSFNSTTHRKQVSSYKIRNLFLDDSHNEKMIPGYSYVGMLTADYIDGRWKYWSQHEYRNKITPLAFTGIRHRRIMSKTTYYTGLSICFFVITLLIASCAWVYLNRQTNVMQGSNPFAIYLLCFGAFLHSLAGLGATIAGTQWVVEREKLNDVYCYAFVWTLYSGYAIEFISYVFFLAPLIKANKDHGIQVNEKQLLSSIIIVVLLGYLTLLTMSFFDPWSLRIVSVNGTNEYGVPNDLRAQCDCKERNNFIYYAASLGLVVVASTIIILRAAAKVRPYDEPYSDGSWMTRCVLSQMYVWLLGVPYIFVIGNISYDVIYLNTILVLFLWTLLPLSFLVVPKVVSVREEKAAVERILATMTGVDESSTSSTGYGPKSNEDSKLISEQYLEEALCKSQADGHYNSSLPDFITTKEKISSAYKKRDGNGNENEFDIPTYELMKRIESLIAQKLAQGSIDLSEMSSNQSNQIESNDEKEKFLEKVIDKALRSLTEDL